VSRVAPEAVVPIDVPAQRARGVGGQLRLLPSRRDPVQTHGASVGFLYTRIRPTAMQVRARAGHEHETLYVS